MLAINFVQVETFDLLLVTTLDETVSTNFRDFNKKSHLVSTRKLTLEFCYMLKMQLTVGTKLFVFKQLTQMLLRSQFPFIDEKAEAVSLWFAFTGCDTVSSFAGREKKVAWNLWNNRDEEIISAFCSPICGFILFFSLSSPSTRVISPDTFLKFERYVILLYDKTSSTTDLTVCRKILFTKNSQQSEGLPPIKDALFQHLKRAVFQGSIIWGQSLVPQQILPEATKWGWKKTNNAMTPLWMTLPEAPKSCIELIKCRCKKSCGTQCKCKRSGLSCTDLCECSGLCFE
nr:uncharacterized protein LOC124808522 [Hydra vulgaris]